MSFPDSVERDHHGRPSFRVNEKIFATLWDEYHLNIMLNPVRIMDVARDNPKVCEEFWWGRKLGCVSVDIRFAKLKLVKELLSEARQRKTLKPRKIARKRK